MHLLGLKLAAAGPADTALGADAAWSATCFDEVLEKCHEYLYCPIRRSQNLRITVG
jgi:hypothetical protein